MSTHHDGFGARATLQKTDGNVEYISLLALAREAGANLETMPVTVKILLENVLRLGLQGLASDEDILKLARWSATGEVRGEFPFLPARVLLQDFTGVPAVVDLAAMRDAMSRLGGDPARINPLAPADLVIDHSVQVDLFGSNLAFARNVEFEYERNRERYTLLRWAQQAFDQLRVVPPGTGICHQVNLEYLAGVVLMRHIDGAPVAVPDTLVGTDSHTTMVNGLGVLGWGVGGIEAEAALLGQPMYLLMPQVVGVLFLGEMREGATATDLVLTVTQLLRRHGVVGKFVEYCGPGLRQLTVADRATLANMSPEYGATAGLFPVDAETLAYLRMTNRSAQHIDLVERYCKEQTLFRTEDTPIPHYSEVIELDLTTVEPSLAGPRRPQDRVGLSSMRNNFRAAFPDQFSPQTGSTGRVHPDGKIGNGHVPADTGGTDVGKTVDVDLNGAHTTLSSGSVAIAAITSCTNTSNPTVMVGAGLLAKKAVERGLQVQPYVKTSLAPGSRVVTDYLDKAGLLKYLEQLHFDVVGYGCTTCIGNSGPLAEPISEAIQNNDLVVASVLSGNRNFEGRIHPEVRASYLASPPLVVAYALAGSIDKDLTSEPLGSDQSGEPVFLSDIWPTPREIADAIEDAVKPELFAHEYAHVFAGDDRWKLLPVPEGNVYAWDSDSTYVQEPPFFQNVSSDPTPLTDIASARVLVKLADSVTTDHISPAGSIPKDSPAGRYLTEHGVERADFNSFGARRGNHEVMIRGTFGNIRLRNELASGKEGDWTAHQPDREVMRIFDAAERYREEGVPLIVLAGKEYGAGSSRDWAAKGPMLLGVKAVIAESYERIHRSNLVAMGILPLQFKNGESRDTLGLTGAEAYTIAGIAGGVQPGQTVAVHVQADDGGERTFDTVARIDSAVEVEYYRHGGVLQMVLRRLNAS
ncbi:MAG: aconitate hydratase AcnA [Chloroflexota bacterium]